MPPRAPSIGGSREQHSPPGPAMLRGATSVAVNALMVANSDAEAEDIDMVVVTYDMRCHGLSTFAGGEEQLSLGVMVADFVDVLRFVLEEVCPAGEAFVLGHSVGGSVVAHALADHKKETKGRVSGVILVDVVEGTAKMSLHYMNDFLRKRPGHFATVKEAQTWFLQHGGMRSAEGAAVSVPPLLTTATVGGECVFVWRTDLQKMEHVWGGWFDELDKKFVSLPYSKMLCLANADRLDTELTVAQMQGKFQFEIIGNNCGHYIMDDATATIAAKVRRFVKRIVVLTRKLHAVNMKAEMTASGGLHFNNATIPASRMPR
ncbi:protein phosphatase methylesterase 1 [Strigomonas culicis]|nr:protein phosphatase methylesterase 1 [Strigomonas culicis]|eukprot:EPY35710.1 protein phosphatase methylesterase 1 [Strigomonas culicis]